ncbi:MULTISPECIES: MmcQ/YjbR family DNA-binding protein [Paenibacillus]|uniref:MmcQ/YjbR family DNA-binding protein n=1 Tax=Paenibacillus TaxID=44249 RepID=UPI0022B8F015|nr:MmcQ/YjbR family DNA-binding protein [Paenibacillus caseinilyticus]MCZ8523634.1 MmcQ/YjbR family DNA-binding protein [Paenibacillus caseinilyticus]
MNHATLMQHGLARPGTSCRYPFDPEMPVLFVGSRMFALLGTHGGRPSVNLKGDPETNPLSRQSYPGTVLPGYHMNKKHWNTVLLDGTLSDQEILDMLEESYLLVCRNLPKSERPAL